MMAEVRFSIAYSADGSVATAWTVAWCGTILGLVVRFPLLNVFVVIPVAVLVVSEVVDGESVFCRLETAVSGCCGDESGTPVKAWKISETRGSRSVHGTVKSGLSHRLCVLGSS